MRILIVLIALFTAACGAPHNNAPESPPPAAAAGALELSDGWAAPTPGGVSVAAGYLTIVNSTSAEDRLIAASSPRAAQVDVHEMSMDGGVMRMRAVEGGLAVPAGGATRLSPGGLHLMFTGVSQPFVEGETIPVTLTFATAGQRTVELPVRRSGGDH